MSAELHPQVEEFLHDLSADGVPPLYRQSLAEARETYRNVCVPETPPRGVGDVADRTVPAPAGDVPVRVYTPEPEGPHPVVVFFHGGGWLLGSVETHDALCRALTAESDCVVVSVEYRRAPENRFPVALEDCYAATTWVADNAAAVDGDPSALAVAGDSAGGTLAAGVALLARDRGGPSLDYQVLAYPATDYRFDTASYEENAQGYFLTRRDMERFWEGYLRDESDGRHPYASPLRVADASGLPPALVVTCGFDPLRDDGRSYADRLADAGVPVTHSEYEDMIHGFLTMLGDPEFDRAHEGVSEVAVGLREQFGLDA